MTKEYIVTEKELFKLLKKEYKDILDMDYLKECIEAFLKSKKPVERLDERKVKGICRKMIHRALVINDSDKGWYEWNTVLFREYIDQILSLIPQQKAIAKPEVDGNIIEEEVDNFMVRCELDPEDFPNVRQIFIDKLITICKGDEGND
jgi:hypothetical protein